MSYLRLALGLKNGTIANVSVSVNRKFRQPITAKPLMRWVGLR